MLESRHMKNRFSFISMVLVVCATLLGACGQRSNTLTIFAATSLTDAQEELARNFETKNPGIKPKINFSSSSNLALQIREGAKADVFMSANYAQMEQVESLGLLHGEKQVFASNRVVLVVPAENPASIKSLDDLVAPNLRIVLALTGTPIRSYTDFLLKAAAQERSSDFLSALQTNIRSEEANVRLVLSKILLGEADAAFVYQTDVTASVMDDVEIIPVPDRYQSKIAYTLAILISSTQRQLSEQFINFVLSPAGQAILAKWGFVPIAEIAG